MTQKAPYLVGAVALLCTIATAPSALPFWAHQRAQLFATCAGRLEAMSLDHHMLDRDERGKISARVDDFQLLLEATIPAALDEEMPEKMPKLWKSKGWSEVAHLLTEMQYSVDQRRADRAEAMLGKRLQECEGILLS